MANRLTLILCLSTLLILSHFTPLSLSKQTSPDDDDDEDLSFLEEPEPEPSPTSTHDPDLPDYDEFAGDEDEDFENYNYDEEGDDDFELPSDFKYEEDVSNTIDDTDVVVLTEGNFSDVIESNRFVMVEFYAPWCGHCQALAPEYAAAATELKSEGVVLAKVDAQEESELAESYEVQGFPTVLFFVDGVHKPYLGQRTKVCVFIKLEMIM
ncbi:putative protein disulfide-isomerase [Helianthus annuus]|nr:putative protein disulfide-isomerase [Helianthus annuus]